MSARREPPDQAIRRQAVDVTRSWLLQAPAGSGKTTVLTARFLALLATVAEPESILAVTFTRKAAAEMQRRVIEALECAATDPQHVEPFYRAEAERALAHATERGWDLLANPARLRIQTLDALNYWLASQLPVTARCGAALNIRVPADALYTRAARLTLRAAEAEPQGATLRVASDLLFSRLDNQWGRFESLLCAMLAARAHWLGRLLAARDIGLGEVVAAGLAALIVEQLQAARQALPSGLLEEGAALARHAAHTLEDSGAGAGVDLLAWLAPDAGAGTALADQGRWRALAALALTQGGTPRQRLTKNEGFVPQAKEIKQRAMAWIETLGRSEAAVAALGAIAVLPDPDLDGADLAALVALGVVLGRAAAELQVLFAERGQVDYPYVAGAARMTLSEQGLPSELALRFGGALRHILVDEFQDTSAEQFDLLAALSAGWEQGDGRTLFVVGDPMQSIYQFREAEVGLFLRARDHGVGEVRLGALELRSNFRSAPGIVEWVNAHCGPLFPSLDQPRSGAIRYLPSASASAVSGASAEVCLHAFVDADPGPESATIVRLIQAERAAHPQCTVAILVAAKRHAAPIARALQNAGIAVRGVDIEPLGERPVVRDLLALARALQHPFDHTAWLALLSAPWCGLNLSQLDRAAPGGEALAWLDWAASPPRGLAPEAQARLRRLASCLVPAVSGAERALPLWQRTERCWRRLGGPSLCAGERELSDARDFLDTLATEPDAEGAVGEALSALTEGLFSRGGAAGGAVDILTIHGAKGLEWDLVLLPGLGRRTARDRDPLLHWIDLPRASEGSDLLLAPIRATHEEPAPRSLAALIRRLRAERQRLERVRLLYVALTRARRSLHLLGHASVTDGVARPEGASLLAMLWPTVGAGFQARLDASEPRASGAGPLSPEPRQWRLPQDFAPAPNPPLPALERISLSSAQAPERPEFSWVGAAARAIGTIVHAELQRLAGGAELLTAQAYAAMAPDYRRWLEDLGVALAERDGAASAVCEAIARTLTDARGRWLLGEGEVRAARSELRLSGEVDGRIEHVIIDRTFLDTAGTRWVVDFKTSRHEGGALEAFVDREAERYRAQLARYATLLSRLGPESIRTALYFPLLGVFRELQV